MLKAWFRRMVCPHTNIEKRQHEYGHAYYCRCCDAVIRVRVIDLNEAPRADGICCCKCGCESS